MRTYKLTLEYDGSRYHGWQDQLNARTVQGELKQAAADVTRGVVDMQGAGRTDSGVHAIGQVAHLKTSSRSHTPAELMKALNDKLPADIVVLAIEEMHLNFHARHDASSRAYLYQIATRKTAFAKKYVWWIKEPLNVEAMSRAAATLVGRHDFVQFAQRDPSKPGESTIVVVEKASVEMDDHLIVFKIEASHFLWKMVRRITGALAKVGLGEWTEADFADLLAGNASPRFDVGASTAPASGLFLDSVTYDGHKPGSHPKSRGREEWTETIHRADSRRQPPATDRDSPRRDDRPPSRRDSPERGGPPFRREPPVNRDRPPRDDRPRRDDSPQRGDRPQRDDRPPSRRDSPPRRDPPFRREPPADRARPPRDDRSRRDDRPPRDDRPQRSDRPRRDDKPPSRRDSPQRGGPPPRREPPADRARPRRDDRPQRNDSPSRREPPARRDSPPPGDRQRREPPSRSGPPPRRDKRPRPQR